MLLGRRLRNLLKTKFCLVYKLATRFGIHILPAHYYAPVPNILELESDVHTWANRLGMIGISVDLDEQIENLRRVCVPFRDEYRGNPHYRRAMHFDFGRGRSRTFGYIEAQVLHAAIRYFRPARVIEIGSGVPTYCTYQAILRNFADTGISGRIMCIEPNPIPIVSHLATSTEHIELILHPIQGVSLEIFERLCANDIVFIDSNHVVKAGGELNYIVLEILPRLPDGVIIQFHDIYLPYDYQRDVLRTFMHANETSILAAFLAYNTRFRILFALSMLHYDRRDAMRSIVPEYRPEHDWYGMRDGEYDPSRHFPSSLWLRVQA